ncbi:MAG TPA: hypothetical protein VKG26_02970 [Bacteroidia bacterium]|nr:hypothetical protein [Bacteroidia bacterium]
MTTTIDFQEWLDNLDDTDIEEIYCLYESISHKTQMGSFDCSENNGILFVTNGDNDQVLKLVSEKAVETFLAKLDKDYGGGFGWVGGQYEFVRSMKKDD